MFSTNDIVCRLCLFADPTALMQIFETATADSHMSSKICSALNYKVSKHDCLPKYICKDCVQKVNFIIAYNMWYAEIHRTASEVQQLLQSYADKNLDRDIERSIISISEKINSGRSKSPRVDYPKMSSNTRSIILLIENILVNVESNCFVPKEKSCSSQKSIEGQNANRVSTVHDICSENKISENVSKNSDDNPLLHLALEITKSSKSEERNSSFQVKDAICMTTSKDTPSGKKCYEQVVCPECGKSFCKRSLLLKHLLSHEGANEKYQCQICRKKFIATSELQRHNRAHRGLKPYKCTKCDRFFSQKNLLDNHLNWHAGRKGHLCDICGQSLSSGPNLRMHMENFHSTQRKKPFKCEECEQSFSRKHHLDNHRTIHETARPHQCTICGVTFKRSSQLKEHENVHTGEKNYNCIECNQLFRTKRVLNVHKLLHSGLKPHQCTVCAKSFVRRGGLAAHMKIHSK